ncbi:hypothetical protein DPMN_087478 [Dreissena polymorpha]|uniref:Uncharacterized protein n=1 Tax=Dreissena polymorpha TaxID=45954 RepID=A0A9D4QW63_DREPO|nr:hypothetical protein DPMN_087478 [Dreissena polymorpha]
MKKLSKTLPEAMSRDVIRTNVLTNFHAEVLTRFPVSWRTRFPKDQSHFRNIYSHLKKNACSRGGNLFQQTGTIFEFFQDTIGTNLLTQFHEDHTINVASSVLTRQMLTPQHARLTKGDHKN